MFSDSKLFRRMVDHKTEKNEVMAITSKGTELVWKDDLAIITSEIKLNKEDSARLMVVGPRRMEYNRVISLMDFIRLEIEDMFK